MGVNLSRLVKAREIELHAFMDKKIAIDAFNWIYQFLSNIRQPDGTLLMDSRGRITSHLSGLFYRNIKLLEHGIKPVYVFDGETPRFKEHTKEERKIAREEAREEWEELLKKGEIEEARKYAQRSALIDEFVVQSSKELLKALGIPYIEAPSEGEAQCAIMCKKNIVYAVASQDYDALLFGAPRLVRNLNIIGKRKKKDTYVIIKPEIIILEEVLSSLNLSNEQLILIALLIGTDYNNGISGYGPKKSLEIVKEKKTFDIVMKSLKLDRDEVKALKEIYDFFKYPKVKEHVNIEFRAVNEEMIKNILCDKYEFSEDRVENALKRIHASAQSSLMRWI